MALPIVSSTRNPRVRAALELRDRRERDRSGRTLVDGVRELGRALDAGVNVSDLFATPAAAERARELVDRARAAGASVILADERVIGRLAYGDRSEGVVAVIGVPDATLDALRLPADALVVVLEGVEKPGNVGAVLRTADAVAASAVIAADPRTDLFNPNTIRASLGTVFSVPVATAASAEVLAWLARTGVRIVAASVDGELDYVDADLCGRVAIVLGSEAAGLSDAWGGAGVMTVRLPMLGTADSLNVSITAAVLLFEARRQRRPGEARTDTLEATAAAAPDTAVSGA
jgi:RNA methyltransferase, TrmH family